MKTLFKKLLLTFAIIFSVSGVTTFISPAPSYAAGDELSCRYFLGMPSWDCGLKKGSDGLPLMESEDDLKNGIIIILANVLTSMSVLAAYLVLGFVIYGGYLYIFSSGDPGKIQTSKKTLTRAFIGLSIVTLSNVILTAIRFAFLNGQSWDSCALIGATSECIAPTDVVTNTIQWFIGSAGIVALIFVIIGGIGYTTSAGDQGKLQKAKNTIIYALIGIIVVTIAEILVSFVSGIIRDANPSVSMNNETLISKEYYEDQIN